MADREGPAGAAPREATVFAVADGRTVTFAVPLGAPKAGEVVVEVAGSALGAAPGAELAGRVVATGEAAAEWAGRRVVVPRALPCGECERCRHGRTASCAAATGREARIATHEVVPARYLLSVEPPLWPEGLGAGDAWQLAAIADAASGPYGALVRAQLAPGDLCLVIGAGARGRIATAVARALAAEVVVLDADPARRALAEAAGARRTLDGEALDAAGVRAALEAEAAAAGLRGVEWKVLETTATAAGRRRALEVLGPGDTAALLDGGDGRRAEVALGELAAAEATVLGAGACHPDLLPELMALLVRGDLRLGAHVERAPFSSLAETLEARRRDPTARLAILTP